MPIARRLGGTTHPETTENLTAPPTGTRTTGRRRSVNGKISRSRIPSGSSPFLGASCDLQRTPLHARSGLHLASRRGARLLRPCSARPHLSRNAPGYLGCAFADSVADDETYVETSRALLDLQVSRGKANPERQRRKQKKNKKKTREREFTAFRPPAGNSARHNAVCVHPGDGLQPHRQMVTISTGNRDSPSRRRSAGRPDAGTAA